ncbi:MAG: response regulator transcription factor [Luminiphilus sp.]|jgi:two-component system LytT family response regulator|nr:response regulator transcription factor [Luminiphilus sp.]CAI8404275.1 MAG: Transcriptional regulatory protein YehT [Halieaceae bacterium]|tara:strand:+ start:612 stop:1397 length:786 start_codon:yes stop_codon:yes gene_type:complete
MTKILRVLIVDDEPLALDYMETILASVGDVEVVGRCRSGREALIELQKCEVDLMFLDIQMPGLNGLEVVKRCQSDVMPVVVFATAYDEYAVRAFEANAVDYLLKPFETDRVQSAVMRARDRLLSVALQSGKEAAVAAIAGLEGGRELLASDIQDRPSRLPIKDGPHTYLIELGTIDWIDAAGDYMCVHANGETYILRSTMKELERKLTSEFVRIHRSTIVNLNKVRSVDAIPKGECLLHLDDEVSLKVSRNYRSAVQDLMG